MFIIPVLLLTTYFDIISGVAILPSSIKTCSRNDPNLNECIVRNANIAIPLLADGEPTLKFLPFDPLHVDKVQIDDSKSKRPLSVNLQLINTDLIGLRDMTLRTVNWDIQGGKGIWTGYVPRIETTGQYDVSGRILTLPIIGNGHCNFTLSDVQFNYEIRIKLETKQNKEYLTAIESKLDFYPGHAVFNLEGLFNGDKRLGDHMNLLLNDNWKEMITDIGSPIAEVFNRATFQKISKIVSLYTYDEIFPA